MRPAHWLIIAALVAVGFTIERASSKIEHALIVSAYYLADKSPRLPLEIVLPGRYHQPEGDD